MYLRTSGTIRLFSSYFILFLCKKNVFHTIVIAFDVAVKILPKRKDVHEWYLFPNRKLFDAPSAPLGSRNLRLEKGERNASARSSVKIGTTPFQAYASHFQAYASPFQADEDLKKVRDEKKGNQIRP